MAGKNGQDIKTEIPLLVVGFDFRIASSALREKLVSTEDGRKYLFEQLKKIDEGIGLLVLETCNRIEWIVSTQVPGWVSEILKTKIIDKWNRSFKNEKNLPSPYVYLENDAVTHVLSVVLGKESLATGEAQIAGQFHSALKRAQIEKTSSTVINRLGHITGRIAKCGYKIGFRSNFRQGIHGLVQKAIAQYFNGDFDSKLVLVAGMGEIGRKTAALIDETFKCNIKLFNRTIKNKRAWFPLNELNSAISDADVLVVATGARSPVIGIEDLNPAINSKKLLVVDIGIPRQVSESVRVHKNIIYKSIDELIEFGNSREKSAYNELIEKEIKKEAGHFEQFCRGMEMSAILSQIHSGRLGLIEKTIPEFVKAELFELEKKRQKEIEHSIKKFVRDYSNNMFDVFHQTMEKYWSKNNGKKKKKNQKQFIRSEPVEVHSHYGRLIM